VSRLTVAGHQDHAVVGNLHTAALVATDGTID
jgi:hypothetical protein